ncbi:RNA polymerase sigma factor [Aureibacillus halotolerans]|uniref:RNA polymerase sigma factor (Sigma-70 family) n=1 Tax=Aureibacillus halotolerans TaxID=1508390 RepID=A0A4R6TS35_9BACI|nr:sigma-70 family RNA polymerase sigma factor [Aureibacillus halotolerans]TDQ36410.1 RNA polymerase sigma factor (sigma-70 family) [Aureibacillus halotolerans]
MIVQEDIQAAANGDEEAFQTIVESYGPSLYRAVLGVLRDPEEAKDATQEALIKIYRSLPSFEGRGLKTWMTRIAVNHAIDMKRKKQREYLKWEKACNEPDDPQEAVDFGLIQTELQHRIRERVQDIPERYRGVMVGYYLEGKTYEEMAASLQVKPKSVEIKLYRARQWLRKHWDKEDFE